MPLLNKDLSCAPNNLSCTGHKGRNIFRVFTIELKSYAEQPDPDTGTHGCTEFIAGHDLVIPTSGNISSNLK